MNKLLVILLLLFVLNSHSQVHIDLEGTLVSDGDWMDSPTLQAYNNTGAKWQVLGWRFYTPDIPWEDLTGQDKYDSLHNKPFASVTPVTEGYFHEGRYARPDQYLFPPKGSSPFAEAVLFFNGKQWDAGMDGTPFDKSVQIKLHERGTPPLPPTGHEPIPANQIDSYVSGVSSYYDTEHRYLDTLGIKGGDYSGGFYDIFGDETQMIIPVTGDTFVLSNSKVHFDPAAAGGPIYFMSLAMMQEYFSEDYQFQMAIGFKETMASLMTEMGDHAYDSKKMNTEGAFGPFEVEASTYVTQAMFYPALYPKYQKELAEAQSVVGFANAVFGNMDGDIDFTSEYAGPYTDEGTPLNSPQIIGCMLGSYGTLQRIYDIIGNAPRLCFKEMLDQGKDRRIAVAALGVMYNRGITAPDTGTGYTVDSAFDVDVYRNYLDDPNANEYLPVGNSDYRKHILHNIHIITSWNEEINADKTIPIYDEYITLDDLKKFFYGEGGSAASQGKGGLLNHFEIDRNAFNSDLESVFNTLSAHWNQSPAAISYRYDWLTVLRSVKQYFYFRRALRPTYDEAARWIANRSIPEGDCGCDSIPVDVTAPYETLDGIKTGNDQIIQFSAIDESSGVKEIIWTTDRDWLVWENGDHVAGTIYDGTWKAVIPGDQASIGDTVWVGLIDKAGNATIRELEIKDLGAVGNSSLNKLTLNRNLKVNIKGNKIIVNNIKSKYISFSLFDLRGRAVYKNVVGNKDGKILLEIPNLTRGTYVLKVKSDMTVKLMPFMKL